VIRNTKFTSKDMAIVSGIPASEKERIRVLIVDDHAIVRAGLSVLIESRPGMIVVGEVGTRAEAVAVVRREQPDIILLDLDINGGSGLDFMREMIESADGARVLILTGVREVALHRRAVSLGAMGLVLKDKAEDVLIKAIERVYAGEVWLDRSLTATVLTEMSRPAEGKKNDPESTKIDALTDREREKVTLVCEGLKNKQIATRLFISEATVRNHLTSILSKLELSDRFELAIYSYRHGLGKPPG
jgi:two-component system, NarL family, nitrate/nitrite response regulator NarL